MNLHQNLARSLPSAGATKLRGAGALLMAGDRVRIEPDDTRIYKVVHISDHKAWVCPLADGAQRIIGTDDLRLVQALRAQSSVLS